MTKKSPSSLKFKVKKTSQVQRATEDRGSKYDDLIEKILVLGEDESLVLDVPAPYADAPTKYRNLVSTAVKTRMSHTCGEEAVDAVRCFLLKDRTQVEFVLEYEE